MQKILAKMSVVAVVFCFLSSVVVSSLSAGTKKGMEGWGNEGEYNKLYNPRELDKLRGTVIKFKKVRPMPGMAKATVLVLDDDGDTIDVYLCPVSFATAKETGIKRGDRVKVKGSWVEMDGEDVFMASKVKKGEYYEFKVRLTKDGSPFWNMSPEELAHERGQQ